MFFSSDKRFIFKTIVGHEILTLKKIMESYYEHVTKTNPNTLLSKIYGLYTIELE